MWEPQPLTTLRASKACRGESFTFTFTICDWSVLVSSPESLLDCLCLYSYLTEKHRVRVILFFLSWSAWTPCVMREVNCPLIVCIVYFVNITCTLTLRVECMWYHFLCFKSRQVFLNCSGFFIRNSMKTGNSGVCLMYRAWGRYDGA
jgi:hypothetical protein